MSSTDKGLFHHRKHDDEVSPDNTGNGGNTGGNKYGSSDTTGSGNTENKGYRFGYVTTDNNRKNFGGFNFGAMQGHDHGKKKSDSNESGDDDIDESGDEGEDNKKTSKKKPEEHLEVYKM